MVRDHYTLPDGRIRWTYEGWPLRMPEGQRWPSPSLHFWYHHGQGYECEANFRTPDEYIQRQSERPDPFPTADEYGPEEAMNWHPPLAYRYSYRTHDGYAMVLGPHPGYPRQWMRGPKLPGLKKS